MRLVTIGSRLEIPLVHGLTTTRRTRASADCQFSRDSRPVACTIGGQQLTLEREPPVCGRSRARCFRPKGATPRSRVRSSPVTLPLEVSKEVGVAGRRADVLDIREMLRRFQAGDGDRRIARDLSAIRKTVSKYRAWAMAEGLLTGPLPEPSALQARLAETIPPPQIASKVAPHQARVVALRARGVECQAIYARLCEEVGFTGRVSPGSRTSRLKEPKPTRTTT
jgi:hypothetical protein